jgi:hypothetical protein
LGLAPHGTRSLTLVFGSRKCHKNGAFHIGGSRGTNLMVLGICRREVLSRFCVHVFTKGTDIRWFKEMGRWKVVYLGFREVTMKLRLGLGHLQNV